jgi:hypothetical protein
MPEQHRRFPWLRHMVTTATMDPRPLCRGARHMHSPIDPLGVRVAAKFVTSCATHVSIDDSRVKTVAEKMHGTGGPPMPSWKDVHLGTIQLSDEELANYVLVLDALNFCFWGHPRWRVSYPRETHNGYWALVGALRRALEEGYPITEARYLSTIPTHDVAMILRGESIIPLFAARLAHLREVGRGLEREWNGSFLTCIQQSGGSVTPLLRRIIAGFPCFVDISQYQFRAIPFYKRAQILVSDVAGAFQGTPVGEVHDLHALTAFADYKVPQVLQQLGVLRYSKHLRDLLAGFNVIPRGSALEVEIRAATIHAVERIAEYLAQQDKSVPAYAVDWYLWELGQSVAHETLPYHRTITAAY